MRLKILIYLLVSGRRFENVGNICNYGGFAKRREVCSTTPAIRIRINMNTRFIEQIETLKESDWLEAVGRVSSEIHPVDRNAVDIWFRIFPLDLVRYLESAKDLDAAMKSIAMQGDFGLFDKIDTSHWFLYGHRFWPQVKAAIIERLANPAEFRGLEFEVRNIAEKTALKVGADKSLTFGIAAVGLMTLVQAGYGAFADSPGEIDPPCGIMCQAPDRIVAVRKRDDSQGLLGFLKTIDKEFTISFEAAKYSGKFKIINNEELASASQKDHSCDWQALDSRCWDGPIPIECTSASCGTCWIGVLEGAEKLTSPTRRERRQMKVFGYGQPDSEKPNIRLACQAKASGNVSIVIPPWNAVFGKKVRGNVENVDLEPVTTSAKKLREAIASVVSSND
ncbi:MAG: hypothetical protein C4325_10210 [Blastocatellia bacterium]